MDPKSGGGVRELGIPTVVDRFIQQAILQVLGPRFDSTFSQYSYGFRPGRSAHDAVVQAQRYVNEGRRFVVDVDLEKFFDRVNHDVLMGRLAKRIEDKRLRGLIRRYLEAGMMANGVATERHEGTPQGGPLSPLLANVLLDEVDKELERRGHAFVRYADDCNVYVRSRRAGERVMELLRRLYAGLRLRVNEAKSAVDRPQNRKLLGYSFWNAGGMQVKRKVAPKALTAMRDRVRELTRPTRSQSIARVVEDLRSYLTGWKNYFRLADTPKIFRELDEWIRHRLRALHLAPLETGAHDLSRTASPGSPRARRRTGRRKHPPMVEELRHGDPHRLPHPLLRRAGSPPTRRVTSTLRTAGCGPACPVVWQGSRGISSGPYADCSRSPACAGPFGFRSPQRLRNPERG
jgi:RNA-directed DNA polymerase